MKKFLLLFLILGFLIGCGYLVLKPKKVEKVSKTEPLSKMEKLENKKVALIISFRDFRDKEYFLPKEILENFGVRVITVSNKEGIAIGADGGETKVDLVLEDLKVEEFDGIFFIGGPGALKNLDNETSYRIAREAVEKGKTVGAICISPTILAKAGVLKGKRATVWTSPLDKTGEKALKENGAEFLKEDVVVDGRIITASGPEAAKVFGEKIVEALK